MKNDKKNRLNEWANEREDNERKNTAKTGFFKLIYESYAYEQFIVSSIDFTRRSEANAWGVGMAQTKKMNNWAVRRSNVAKIWLSNERIQTKATNKCWKKNGSNNNETSSLSLSMSDEVDSRKKKSGDRHTERNQTEWTKITLNTYSPLTDGLLKLYAFRKENKINEREKMK